MPRKKKFDPVKTLRDIAADENAGSTARVAACRALIQFERDNADTEPKDKDAAPTDAITRKALRLLNGGKRD